MDAKRLLLLILVLTLAACGSDDDPVAPGGGDDDPVILPPDADGMLLPGEDGGPAVAPVTLLPTPADPEHVANGHLLSRLTAVIDPDATVADVNVALTDHGAAIVSMLEGSPLVTVVVPPVADLDAAEVLAASLAGTPGFVSAWPGLTAQAVTPIESAAAVDKRHPPHADALDYATHTTFSRLATMWSLRTAALADTRIIVPHFYPEDGNTNEMPNFELIQDAGSPVPPSNADLYVPSAAGHHLAGVAGANWTFGLGQEHTGIDPMDELLQLQALSVCGLTVPEILTEVARQRPLGRTVLLSALTYDDPAFEAYPHLARLHDALHWRRALVHFGAGTDFLHVAAAGGSNDEGPLQWNSPWAMATAGGLRELAQLYAMPDEAGAFEESFDTGVASDERIGEAHTNIILVGSAGPFGQESEFSTPGTQVRFMGEAVPGPCSLPDYCGGGESRTVSGTGVAAAQAAGLASFMWHINPSLGVQDLMDRIHHAMVTSSAPGLVDGLIAALSTDSGVTLQTSPARLALLDLDENSRFDEADLASFLDAFENLGGQDAYFTRWDLNGDGDTGGSGTAKFDLDANALPGFTTVTQGVETTSNTYDENGLTDLEILCYYAYSPLYQGDPDARLELLADCAGPGSVVLVDTVHREVEARARVDRSSAVDALEIDHADPVALTMQADTSRVAGDWRGNSSSTTTLNSSVNADEFGNFVGLTVGGSGDVDYDGTWGAAKADEWLVAAYAETWCYADFTVVGADADYDLDFDFSAILTDDLTQMAVSVEIYGYEEGTLYTYYRDDLASDIKDLNGTLPPDDYRLSLRFTLRSEASGLPTGTTRDGGGSANWGLTFALRP